MDLNVNKLKEGMVIKNYNNVCELLGIVPNAGHSKAATIKHLSRYVNYTKDGHKFIINEVYEKPIKWINGQYNRKHDSILETHSDKCKLIIDSCGIDLSTVTFHNKNSLIWKCELCANTFKRGIRNALEKDVLKCNKCNKSKDSQKIYSLLEKYYIPFDDEITFPDLKVVNHLRFDYGLFKDSNVVALIEYDGGFHDTNETNQEYDRIKDEYCKSNNIPLLRIHHTEIKHLKVKLLTFLYSFYPTTVIANELLAASRKIEIENQKLLAKVETNNKLLKDLLEVIK